MFVVEQVRPVGTTGDSAMLPKPRPAPFSPKPRGSRSDADDQEAAVAEWEAFVARVKAACQQYNTDHAGGKPANFVRYQGEDVRKSDSLRYPFEGELVVHEVLHFGKVYVEDVRWHFGWKGGRWEYKDSTYQRIKTPGGPTDPDQLDEQPLPVSEKTLEGEKKKLILECLR